MSLVTRCSACATPFKVVKDQLHISDGWVRCGRCGEVFDATLDLRDVPEPAAPPLSPTIADSPEPPPLTEDLRERWPDPGLLSLGGEARADMPGLALPSQSPVPDIDLSLRVSPPMPVTETARDAAGDESAPDADAPPPWPEAGMPPSFVNDGVVQGGRRRGAAWLVMMAAALVLLCVALLGQAVYQERDRIAARQPSLQPALASMCRWLGCAISPLRRIDDIKVDGASFARKNGEGGEGYSFSFTLRNMAGLPLAMPAVELSLLDSQERPIVRRVLMPAEFGAPAVLPARSERSASLSLGLTGPEAASFPPVIGFRVETFYP
jgi:predicted Zn finger-like uncharacterized protein